MGSSRVGGVVICLGIRRVVVTEVHGDARGGRDGRVPSG